MKPGRNDPCPCGSGKKYKKCCLRRETGSSARASRLRRSTASAQPLQRLPVLVDARSGEPSLMVTDRWKVRDWDALAAALDAHPEVQGSREESWARLEDPEARLPRVLLGINPGKGDRLETFGRSRSMADEGRAWLLEVAGEWVEHVSREEVDPMAALAEMLAGRSGSGGFPGGLLPGLQPGGSPFGTSKPLAMTTEMMQEILERIYGDWADEPIPALGGHTPRQAAKTSKGRKKVIELLELYEKGELEQASQQERQPASFEFLWQAVGLERE